MSTADTGSTQAATLRLLYRSHYDWLREWLARRLGNRETGANLAQDTLVRLLIKHREGRIVTAAGAAPKEHTRAYLTTIANGLLVDHLRRRKIERAYADAIALDCAQSTARQQPSETFLHGESTVQGSRLPTGNQFRLEGQRQPRLLCEPAERDLERLRLDLIDPSRCAFLS